MTNLLVLFGDLGPLPADTSAAGPDGDENGRDGPMRRMEAELRLARDQLQAMVEEREAAQHAARSASHEFRSINEELQAVNEALETTNEELQSVNEELQAVNGELAERVTALGRANGDLTTLLEASRVATLILDDALRIRSFSPGATALFHVRPSDLGRRITEVAGRIDYPEIELDVGEALRTREAVERRVPGPDGSRVQVRVVPHGKKAGDPPAKGAIVVCIDLGTFARTEEGARSDGDT